MRALNIIIIAAADFPEGTGEAVRLKTMAGAIKDAGHKVQILLENTSGNIDQALLKVQGDVNGVPFRYILGNTEPLNGLGFFTSKFKAVKMLLAEIKRLHKKEGVDIIWINQLAAHTIYPVTRLAEKLGIRTVQSYEDDRMKGKGLKRKLIYANQVLADNYLSVRANAIVAISHYLKDKYHKLTKGKVPVYIIPTVLDVKSWTAAPEPNNKTPLLLYYGAFFGFDEIEKIIDAVKTVKESGQPIRLFLVGQNRKRPEYMQNLANYVESLGIGKEIEFKGFTKHDRLKEYINEANILIGLRKDEEWSQTGLSTKLSEYLSTGRMVICTAIGDNTRYLQNNKSAVLMPPGCSTEALANAIIAALKDDEKRKRIGEAGRQVALNNFDFNAVKGTINKMFSDVLS